MDYSECIKNYITTDKNLKKTVVYSAITAGFAVGAYIGIKKIVNLIEDKRLARYYEDEIEKIFNEKERMKFYEDEFIRQENEENEKLKKNVDEFNSRRLKRQECPQCGKSKRKKEDKIK